MPDKATFLTATSTQIVDTSSIMRVFGAISAALALGSAAAFMPQVPKPQLDLGKAVQKLMVAPVAILGINSAPMMVPPAHADGSVSAATVTRAGVLYGPRVIKVCRPCPQSGMTRGGLTRVWPRVAFGPL